MIKKYSDFDFNSQNMFKINAMDSYRMLDTSGWYISWLNISIYLNIYYFYFLKIT